MNKLLACGVAAFFGIACAAAGATEVTRTDEVRVDPDVQRSVNAGKKKVKRTAKKAKKKTRHAANRTRAAAHRAADRTEAAGDRAAARTDGAADRARDNVNR
jgi:hypothetical protein